MMKISKINKIKLYCIKYQVTDYSTNIELKYGTYTTNRLIVVIKI